MARFILPTWQVLDNNGDPLAGAKLNFYTSGGLVRKDTFSDDGLTTANANPVVADSAGRFGDIFLESGTYRVVLTDSDDVQIWDRDPVDGAVGNSGTVDEITSAYTVAIGDSTKVLAVDATSGAVTITLLAAATAGDGFEVTIKKVDSSANAVTIDGNGAETIDGDTTLLLTAKDQTVTIRSDATGWQVTSSYAVSAGIVRGQRGTAVDDDDVDGSNILTLPMDGNSFNFSGTQQVDGIATLGVGTTVRLVHTSVRQLTHHATDLILPGAANITTASGDVSEWEEYATGDWRCTNYSPAAAVAVPATQAEMEAASATSRFVTPGRQHFHPGHPKAACFFSVSAALQSNSVNVSSITDNGTGDFSVNFTTSFASTAYIAQFTTDINGGGLTDIFGHINSRATGACGLRLQTTGGSAAEGNVAFVHFLALGDFA